MSQLVEIKPVKPFVGSYRCSLSEADMIEDGLKENDDGTIVKVKIPKKRFVGLISVQRAMRAHEREMWLAGTLPENIEVLDEQGMAVMEHPLVRTIFVPPEVASSLVSRQLAELVKSTKAKVPKDVAA
jgi:hypothetical protein